MTKVAGSYESVIRGVSQQAPHIRRSGQHGEQVNIISDPVKGAVRRHGSRQQAAATFSSATDEHWDPLLEDTADHEVLSFRVGDKEYDLIYRASAVATGMPNNLSTMFLFSKTDKVFCPIHTTGDSGMVAINELIKDGGFSAAVNVGQYVVLGMNRPPADRVVTLDNWNVTNVNARYHHLWVRGSAYNRTFTITVTLVDGTRVTGSYTSPSSGYPHPLDTSDIRPKIPTSGGGATNANERLVASGVQDSEDADFDGYAIVTPLYLWARTAVPTTVTDVDTSTTLSYTSGNPGAAQYTIRGDRLVLPSTRAGHTITVVYNHWNLTDNPSYQQQVNDRTNEYNSAVTAWITTAAAGASPDGIGRGLFNALADACWDLGYWRPVAFPLPSGTNYITDRNNWSALNFRGISTAGGRLTLDIKDVEVSDGGDGSLIRAVSQTVTDIDKVGPYDKANRVIKVLPKDGDAAAVTYLKAVPKSGVVDTANPHIPVEVIWQETAGVEVHPRNCVVYGTVHRLPSGVDALVLGTSKPTIDLAVSTLLGTAYADTPAILPSVSGDLNTFELPRFFTNPVSYLGLFQDRLVIGSGAELFMSRPGDYFNWFPKSTTTVNDDDPVQLVAYGTETDTIRRSTTYDRNLMLFGSQFQYVVSGRVPITPANGALVPISAHEDATAAAPVASGNYVFYGREANGFASLHQIQAGLVADSPESYEITQAVGSYLHGTPVQIIPFTAPNILVVRTTDYRDGFYVYSYLDSAASQERLFDSWSRWVWSDKLGKVIGLAADHGYLMVYMLFKFQVAEGEFTYGVRAERFSFDTELSNHPYLDGLNQRGDPFQPFAAGLDLSDVACAFDATSEHHLIGAPAARVTELEQFGDGSALWVGWQYPAYLTPTNPYKRDQNGKAVLTGRTTIIRLILSLVETAGFTVDMQRGDTIRRVQDSSARRVSPTTLPGIQPVETYQETAMLGGEVREFSYTLAAKQWLPFCVSAIEYVGQYFNNTRRM